MNKRYDTSFADILLRWFRENGRDLPWRNLPDDGSREQRERKAYAVWLSEVILQQTRIQQGWEYWERFMRRWPTVNDMAAATEDEVLREWQGLGYYSRARNLHHAARQVVEMGHFPDTLNGIRQLKGVGDYTAAAIGSIVFGLPAAVVDGNVYRVLARHFGIDTPINSTEGKKVFAALAQDLLPVDAPADFNQAMMDFGAIQCTPQSPHCLLCPLAGSCDALHTGRVAELPVKIRNLKVQQRHLVYIYIRCQGYTVIRRRPVGDIWAGLWEPVGMEGSQPIIHHARLLRKGVRHVLTHRVILADFYLLELNERVDMPAAIRQLMEERQYVWIKEEDIGNYGVPRLVELLLEAVDEYDRESPNAL